MGQNTHQLLQLILIVLAFAAVVIWVAPLELNGAVWAIRILTPIGAIGMGYVVFKVSRMPDKIPDFLREHAGRYFEREGLCFAPVFEVVNATAWMCIYFQNRHARESVATIEMWPAIRSFRDPSFGAAQSLSPSPANFRASD